MACLLLFLSFFFSGSGETERHTKVSGGGDQIPWKYIPKQATCYQTFCCNNRPPGFLVPVEEMEEMVEMGAAGGKRREEGGRRTMWFRLRRWRKWRRGGGGGGVGGGGGAPLINLESSSMIHMHSLCEQHRGPADRPRHLPDPDIGVGPPDLHIRVPRPDLHIDIVYCVVHLQQDKYPTAPTQN